MAQSRSFFDRALAADPDNVDALVGSARADARAGSLLFVTDPMAAFAAAEAKLTKALSSVPDDARGHSVLGFVEIQTKRAAQGVAECEHALELDRNLADTHSVIGFGKIFIGRAEETEAHIVEALRLSPRDTMAYAWMTIAGISKNHFGLWEQAVAWFRRRSRPTEIIRIPILCWAARLRSLVAWTRRVSAVKAGLALDPAFSILRARVLWTALSDDPKYLAGHGPFFEGLRKAGVPEQ